MCLPPASRLPVGIKIAGPDLELIERIGLQMEKVLAEVEGTTSVFSERVAGGRYVTVDIDRHQPARLRLNIADVQDIVRSALERARDRAQ
jgi:Cu(I)/Ag(I) efflux system membrane protein CusA/SilA